MRKRKQPRQSRVAEAEALEVVREQGRVARAARAARQVERHEIGDVSGDFMDPRSGRVRLPVNVYVALWLIVVALWGIINQFI